jgi:hypothetical protein
MAGWLNSIILKSISSVIYGKVLKKNAIYLLSCDAGRKLVFFKNILEE